MKTAQIILHSISSIAFYIGAVFFFIGGNRAAGALGTAAGTLSLVALIMNLCKKK